MDFIRNPTRQGLALSLLLLLVPLAWPLVMYMWLRYATGHRGARDNTMAQSEAPSAPLEMWSHRKHPEALDLPGSQSKATVSFGAGKVVVLVVVVFLAGVALTAVTLAPGRQSAAAIAASLSPEPTGPAFTFVPVTGTRGDVPYDVYYADGLTDAQRQWCDEQPYLVADALQEFQLVGFDQWDGETWNGNTAAFEQTGNYTSGCSVAWYRHQHASTSLAAPVFPFGTLPYRLTLPEDWIGATNAADWAKAVVAYDDAHTRPGATKLADDSPDRTWPGGSVAPGSFVALRVERYSYAFGALLIFAEAMAGQTPEEALDWWEANAATRFYGDGTPGPDDRLTVERVDLPIGPAIALSGRSEDIGSEPTFRTMYVIPVDGTEYVMTFQLSGSSELQPADTLRVVESFRMRAG